MISTRCRLSLYPWKRHHLLRHSQQKCLHTSLRLEHKYFVTTPIFYVNAAPHLGHLYTAVLADALTRWQRLVGNETLFSTGTDEHGLKVQQAASKNKVEPLEYCNQVSALFKRLFENANIGYDDYIRTTEPRHKESVQWFWERLDDAGCIYKDRYEGWYCVTDECYLSEDEVTDSTDGEGNKIKVSVESGNPVTWMTEDNYKFRLSQFTDRLSAWLDSGVIHPSKFEAMVRRWVEDLPELSVSRPSDRLPWGIPVPGDPSQTIYVWLDALVNYLTVAGFPGKITNWPPDCQIIGKDILRFHAVYWPAFLMAAGMDPPKRLLVHSHWMVDGFKMSKSRRNVVDPVKQMSTLSADGLRYFLMKEGVPHSDGNYSDAKAVECVNSDLVNTLGNLLSRCTSAAINPRQVFTEPSSRSLVQDLSRDEQAAFSQLNDLPDIVAEHYENVSIYKSLDAIMRQLNSANALMQHHQPWQLAKSNSASSRQHLDTVVHVAMETLRRCGILLQPVTPGVSDKLLSRLGISPDSRRLVNAKSAWPCESDLGPTTSVLLKRIDRQR
ncbi:methionine--tRNA ligase, mitochondrial-like [Gigantopelta aegis]|uniref:methionine--tRNA ligase, mitochondrial-like n=1 Tax=Gigantopelta aegis TaxID=1735272 RepID=UPI001B88889B|nr:methionine--tRNA ligase, mitochondrial-like [Gigantopelta aegis]